MPNVAGVAGDQLKSLVERVERLEGEKAAIAADISEVYAQAKSEGFDIKVMRQIVKERRMDRDDFEELETLLDIYRAAIGQVPMADAAE